MTCSGTAAAKSISYSFFGAGRALSEDLSCCFRSCSLARCNPTLSSMTDPASASHTIASRLANCEANRLAFGFERAKRLRKGFGLWG